METATITAGKMARCIDRTLALSSWDELHYKRKATPNGKRKLLRVALLRGRARFKADNDSDNEDREISAGSVIFVAAQVEHRFYNIEEELAVLVFFAPAES